MKTWFALLSALPLVAFAAAQEHADRAEQILGLGVELGEVSAAARRQHAKGFPMAEISSSRIVITVLGKNRPGIVAGVTRVLGEANVDIRDITQSIIEDIFTMTMLADTAESKLDFAELQKALAEAGELSGVNVSIQREDVFNFMYRL